MICRKRGRGREAKRKKQKRSRRSEQKKRGREADDNGQDGNDNNDDDGTASSDASRMSERPGRGKSIIITRVRSVQALRDKGTGSKQQRAVCGMYGSNERLVCVVKV